MSSYYNFEEWKRLKMERGEWLSPEAYKKKKAMARKKALLEELDKINKLYPEEDEFEVFFQQELDIVNKTETGKLKRKRSIEDIDSLSKSKKKKLSRKVILDTETTGLGKDDRIVEISVIELIDDIKTGRRFHCFLNPETKISRKAIEIHQITNEKVKDCPVFIKISQKLLNFIGDAEIIAHNAKFDRRMLNNELNRCGLKSIPENRFIDTLEISRYLFPHMKNSQDALCERFNIDNKNRVETGIHSAAEDTAQLYLVYQELITLLNKQNLYPEDFKINSLLPFLKDE